ncbi:MAG: hypothetical protein R3E79_55825 [Caldilineaceae bacterium]
MTLPDHFPFFAAQHIGDKFHQKIGHLNDQRHRQSGLVGADGLPLNSFFAKGKSMFDSLDQCATMLLTCAVFPVYVEPFF